MSIQRIDFNRGDIVVLQPKQPIPGEERQFILELWKNTLAQSLAGGCPMLYLRPDIDIIIMGANFVDNTDATKPKRMLRMEIKEEEIAND